MGSTLRTVAVDPSPAQQAGVSAPADQEIPGTVAAFALAAVLVAVGVLLEITSRYRRRV